MSTYAYICLYIIFYRDNKVRFETYFVYCMHISILLYIIITQFKCQQCISFHGHYYLVKQSLILDM